MVQPSSAAPPTCRSAAARRESRPARSPAKGSAPHALARNAKAASRITPWAKDLSAPAAPRRLPSPPRDNHRSSIRTPYAPPATSEWERTSKEHGAQEQNKETTAQNPM